MSFLKIRVPVKRNQAVEEYLDLKKNIRDNLLSEKTGEKELQTDLSKFFKPITETQKATAREITEELKPVKEGIESLPQAITFPAYPSIEASKEPLEPLEPLEASKEPSEEGTQYIGELARKNLGKFATKNEADRTYGLYDIKGKFFHGNKPITIKGNNIIVDCEDEYIGTPGLWELIVSKNPQYGNYADEDIANYAKLMIKTNALHRKNNPEDKRPKSSKGDKWNNILSDIWKNRKYCEGSGVIVIPSDPNTLLERLDLLLASQKAGHTGVVNELVSICDELKRQGVLDVKTYRKLNSIIKK